MTPTIKVDNQLIILTIILFIIVYVLASKLGIFKLSKSITGSVENIQDVMSNIFEPLKPPTEQEKQVVSTMHNNYGSKNYWHEDYWKNFPTVPAKPSKLMLWSKIDEYVKIIQDSWGYFNDDEEAIYNVFKKLTHAAHVSQLASRYKENGRKMNKYFVPLIPVLIDSLTKGLSVKEMNIVNSIVEKLPKT